MCYNDPQGVRLWPNRVCQSGGHSFTWGISLFLFSSPLSRKVCTLFFYYISIMFHPFAWHKSHGLIHCPNNVALAIMLLPLCHKCLMILLPWTLPLLCYFWCFVLGFEIEKLSKILIKTSNIAEYIESDIQNIKTPRTDDPII